MNKERLLKAKRNFKDSLFNSSGFMLNVNVDVVLQLFEKALSEIENPPKHYYLIRYETYESDLIDMGFSSVKEIYNSDVFKKIRNGEAKWYADFDIIHNGEIIYSDLEELKKAIGE